MRQCALKKDKRTFAKFYTINPSLVSFHTVFNKNFHIQFIFIEQIFFFPDLRVELHLLGFNTTFFASFREKLCEGLQILTGI